LEHRVGWGCHAVPVVGTGTLGHGFWQLDRLSFG
jgi:hypothetical protein